MPEEILAIIIISIFAGTAMSLTRMILAHRRSMKGSAGSSSLTTSELERMMRRAVEEATEPLQRKIEDLELDLVTGKGARKLEAPRKDLLLDLEDEEDDAVDGESAAVRAQRSRD